MKFDFNGKSANFRETSPNCIDWDHNSSLESTEEDDQDPGCLEHELEWDAACIRRK